MWEEILLCKVLYESFPLEYPEVKTWVLAWNLEPIINLFDPQTSHMTKEKKTLTSQYLGVGYTLSW